MTKQSLKINTVLLDADGVVQTSGASFVADVAALCPNPSQRKAFLEDVFLAERPCLTGQADFPGALRRVLVKWEIDIPTTTALELWQQIRPDPEILNSVASLRDQGIRVCLATNQQAHRADIMAHGLGYSRLFDDMFFSCQLGVAKPAPNFFRKILNHLDTIGESSLFIDDHPQNVAGAKDAGIFAEVYHIEEGPAQFTAILERHDLSIA